MYVLDLELRGNARGPCILKLDFVYNNVDSMQVINSIKVKINFVLTLVYGIGI